jgi:hypothetical protein
MTPIFIFSGKIDCAPVTIVSPFLTVAYLGTSINCTFPAFFPFHVKVPK